MIYLLKQVILNSYVELPEGIFQFNQSLIIKMWAWNQYRHYSSGFQWDVYIQQYQMEFLNRGLETL